jgi:hypothetical protein
VVELLQEEQTSIGGEIAPVEIHTKILVAFQSSSGYNSHQKNPFHRFDVGLEHLHFTMNGVLFLFTFQVKLYFGANPTAMRGFATICWFR